jgi:hypothetical protein
MAEDAIDRITDNLTTQQAVRQLVGRIWFSILANDRSEWKARMEAEVALYTPLLMPQAARHFVKQMHQLLPFYERVHEGTERPKEVKTVLARTKTRRSKPKS